MRFTIAIVLSFILAILDQTLVPNLFFPLFGAHLAILWLTHLILEFQFNEAIVASFLIGLTYDVLSKDKIGINLIAIVFMVQAIIWIFKRIVSNQSLLSKTILQSLAMTLFFIFWTTLALILASFFGSNYNITVLGRIWTWFASILGQLIFLAMTWMGWKLIKREEIFKL